MLDAGNLEWGEAVAGREASCLNQWARAFIGWGRGIHAGTTQSVPTVILKLSSVVWPASSWLFKAQLIFSHRVCFHFLRPVLRIVAVHIWMWELEYKESWALKNWCFLTVVLEKSVGSPLDCKEIQPVHSKGLNVHWKDWCWSWNSNTLATWYEELTHLKRPWCWERLKAGGEGDDRWWDGWMASPTQWIWVWVNSRSWWWTGRPGVLWSMGSQKLTGHDWASERNWCHGYSLIIVYPTSPPGRGFSIYMTAHRIWLRMLSIAIEKELKVLD